MRLRFSTTTTTTTIVLVTLVLVALVCASSTLVVRPAHAMRFTKNLAAGVIWPATAVPDQINIPVQLAYNDLFVSGPNATALDFTFYLFNTSSGTSASDSVNRGMDLYRAYNVNGSATVVGDITTTANTTLIGLIGDKDDTSTTPLALVTSATSILLISPTATTTTANDHATYTYFVRTIPSDTLLAMAISAAIDPNYLPWARYAIIHSDDDSGRGFLDYMVRNPDADADISVFSVPSSDTLAPAVIAKVLTSIVNNDLRVIILHGTQSLNVLALAYAAGLLDTVHTWVGTTWCTHDTLVSLNAKGVPAAALAGTICFDRRAPSGANWDAFTARVLADPRAAAAFPDNVVPAMSGYAYDAAYALFAGVRNVHFDALLAATPANVFKAVNAITFTGVTGDISFDASADRIASVDVLNFDRATSQYKSVGTYTRNIVANQSNLDLQVSAISWADASAITVPKDRPHVYAKADVLPTEVDGRVLVLAYVISVLGAWTTLILLEQAVSIKQQDHGWDWVPWTAASALALGSCSVWPMQFIGTTALSLDTVPLYFEYGLFVGSAFVPFALVFIAFMIAMSDVTKRDRFVRAEDSSTYSEGSVISRTSGSVASRSTVSTSGQKQRRMKRTLTYKLWMMLQSFNWRVLVSALFVGAAIMVTHELVVLSLKGDFVLSRTTGLMIVSAIVACVASIVPLLMFFFLHKSAVRFLAAFLMGAINIACFLISEQTRTYSRGAETNTWSSYLHADGTVTLVVAATCAGVCFLLMAINVAKLKITRKTLDRVLVQVQEQMTKLEAQLNAERKDKQVAQNEMEFARRTLEVINLCRPLHRNYAVALALADVDPTVAAAISASAQHMAVSKELDEQTSQQRDSSVTHTDKVGNEEGLVQGRRHVSERSVEGGGGVTSGLGTPYAAPGSIAEGDERDGILEAKSNATTANTSSLLVTVQGASVTSPGGSNAGGASAASARKADSDFALVHCKKNEKTVMRLLNEFSGALNMENTALQQKLLSEVKLNHLLAHPATFEFLKDVLSKNFTPENLAMWCDIQRYRAITNAQVRKTVAEEIYQVFIANGSKYEVNISGGMKDVINQRMANERFTPDLFDEVEKEILRLITTNNMDSFASTPAYRVASLVLAHLTPNENAPSPFSASLMAALAAGGNGMASGAGVMPPKDAAKDGASPVNNNAAGPSGAGGAGAAGVLSSAGPAKASMSGAAVASAALQASGMPPTGVQGSLASKSTDMSSSSSMPLKPGTANSARPVANKMPSEIAMATLDLSSGGASNGDQQQLSQRNGRLGGGSAIANGSGGAGGGGSIGPSTGKAFVHGVTDVEDAETIPLVARETSGGSLQSAESHDANMVSGGGGVGGGAAVTTATSNSSSHHRSSSSRVVAATAGGSTAANGGADSDVAEVVTRAPAGHDDVEEEDMTASVQRHAHPNGVTRARSGYVDDGDVEERDDEKELVGAADVVDSNVDED